MSGNKGEDLMLVGIGASAGGVEALMQFFGPMPADTGLAFVVILHLPPGHESRLAQVLQPKTRMPVTQVTEPVSVEPNRVYVVPPDKNLYMSDGQIRLAERGRDEGGHAPVDLFFRTLADSWREKAIAVVLSGSGADGSVGITRVKEEGGVTIAQNPGEAEYAQMPRAAVETGAVDFVLPVAAMPEKLVSLHRNAERIQLPPVKQPRRGADEDALREVLALLRARTRHDFSDYKRATLLRRIERRMQVTETEDLPAYLAQVREHPEELQALLSDLLISVTNYFRDREAFGQLEQEVVPLLFAGKGPDDQIRVWVAGCATGEEAYSVAMLLAESAARHSRPPAVQVFASDIDEAALQRAREGVYPAAIAADVSPERLKRFFTKEGQYYRVKRELRELVLFASHNVLRDPPFSKLDLVSCRNLLIYINRQTQNRVLEIFHFALRPGGHLFLGSSESADGLTDLFAPVDKKHRLFRRLDLPPAYRGALTLPVVGRWETRRAAAFVAPPPGTADELPSFGELHYRTLEALGPPSVLVNAEYDIVHSSERAGRFLRFVGGEPSRNLLSVAHPDLQLELRSLLLRAEQAGAASRDVPVQLDGGRRVVRVSVRPVVSQRTAPGFRLVVFEELPEAAAPQGSQPPEDSPPIGDEAAPAAEADEGLGSVVQQLDEEMRRLREQLRATVEMYETQAEEFKAANEELQAMNEELRSASEELETGKEELQSVNEELTTVNNELKEKVEEVGRANSDLQNLMHATQIGTLFLDRQQRIKRYTPGLQELFNLLPGDVGRPLAHLTHRLDYAGLVGDAESVLRTLHAVERETRAGDGRYFMVRLMPYRTTDDRIEGVVVTFVDITDRKRAEESRRRVAELDAFRVALADALRPLTDPLEIQRAATRVVGERLSVDRVLYAEIGDDGETITIADNYVRGRHRKMVGQFSAGGFGTATEILRAGQTFITTDAERDERLSVAEREALLALGNVSIIAVPLVKDGRWVSNLGVYHGEPRVWTPDEIRLLEEAAERTWAAVERARVAEALRQSEERMQRVLETDAVGVIFFDHAGTVIDANHAFLEMTGYTRDDIERRELTWRGMTPPEWVRESEEQLEKMAATGRIGPYEKEYILKDGSRKWMLFAGRDLGDGTISEYCIDITGRKRAEEALRASEERLRLVVESVEDYAIFTTDAEGRINSWNPGAERMFGYSEEEAVGQNARIIFTPEDQERGAPEDEMRRALREGRALDERWHLSKRGVRFYLSGILAPLRDARGELTGYAKIARDLTERKELEEALRRAHDELEERVQERTRELQETAAELLIEVKERAQAEGRARALLGQIVTIQEEERRRIARELHDTLGQQLAALSLSIDILKSKTGGHADVREETERMQSIFDRLNSDVDFLAWELRPAVLDTLGLDAALQTFVREWSEHFKVSADYRGSGGDAPRLAPEVETNLYRILQEALQNVHKHAGADRVSVQLEQRDGRVVLIVEDNGKGYDPDAEVAADSNKGMGVVNMRERAALVGGELEIESAPGAGTTIFVRVPLGAAERGGEDA